MRLRFGGHLLEPSAAGAFVPGCPQSGVSVGIVPPVNRLPTSASLQVHATPGSDVRSSPPARALSFKSDSPLETDAQPAETPKSSFKQVFPDAVFTLDYSDSWPWLLEMVSKNFHPKEHHVQDNFGRAYKFVNSKARLEEAPSPSSFPLRVMKGFYPVTPEKTPLRLGDTRTDLLPKIVGGEAAESGDLRRVESSQTEVNPTQRAKPEVVRAEVVESSGVNEEPPKDPSPRASPVPSPVGSVVAETSKEPVVTSPAPPHVPVPTPVRSGVAENVQEPALTPPRESSREVPPAQVTPVASPVVTGTPGASQEAQRVSESSEMALVNTSKKPNMYQDGSYWKTLVILLSACGLLRMQRVSDAIQNGKSSASPEICKLFGTPAGRLWAANLLPCISCQATSSMSSSWSLVRWRLSRSCSSVRTPKKQKKMHKVHTTLSWGSASSQGGMRQELMCCWAFFVPRTMAKNAAKWAKENGLSRDNPIHGKEEYKLVVKDSFRFSQRHKTTTRATAVTTLQAR